MIRTLLKELVLENNITLKELAKDTGLTLSTVTKYHDNTILNYNIDILHVFIRYFNLNSIDQLLLYIDENESKYDFSLYS